MLNLVVASGHPESIRGSLADFRGGAMLAEMPSIVPTATEVQEARELLRKYLQPTRLVRAESLERCSKGQVHLKIESDLPTGSFKPRGALFALLTNAERGALAGVVAASTGNHGAAVAYAARIVNLAATIFLPENPNPVKRARILGLGAKIVERGRCGSIGSHRSREGVWARAGALFSG
jgi:threonine dehydratase